MGDAEHHLVTPPLGNAEPNLVTPPSGVPEPPAVTPPLRVAELPAVTLPSTDAEPPVVTTPAELGKDEGKNDPAIAKKDEDGDDLAEAIPVGNPIKEENGRKYYKGFEYDRTEFKPLDTVTLNPDEGSPDTPYVALIKDVYVEEGEEPYMTIQWFYRPDEAKKKRGGLFSIRRKNEVFYSFHTDEVPAGSVFHKKPVHLIRHTKSSAGIPESEYFVHRVYDHVRKRLRDLEEDDYSDPDKVIIGSLIHRAEEALGDLPDASPEELASSSLSANGPSKESDKKKSDKEEVDRKRRRSGRLDGKSTEIEDDAPAGKRGKPTGAKDRVTEEQRILDQYGALSGDQARDTSMAFLYKEVSAGANGLSGEDKAILISRLKELEQAAFDLKGQDRKAYNQLLRHTAFNLKKEDTLRRRFFGGELKGSVIVRMDPNELKEGYTAEEKKTNEPVQDDPDPIEMVDKTCPLCSKRQVGVRDIIAGGKGQVYQLECLNCGHTFTENEANIVKVTAGPVDPLKHEKDAPSASMKFSDVEHEMEAQEELLGDYKEARIHPPEAAQFPEEVAGGQGRQAAELGSLESVFKESNALKNPADTELGGPQAGGNPVGGNAIEAAVLLSGS